MLAGKRCSPWFIFVAIAVIVLAIVAFYERSPNNPPPENAPLHQPR